MMPDRNTKTLAEVQASRIARDRLKRKEDCT